MLEIITVILFGLTIISEAYVFGIAHVFSLYGIDFILNMGLAAVMPLLTAFFLYLSINKRKKGSGEEQIEVGNSEPEFDRKEAMHSMLSKIASAKPTLAAEARKADEQLTRTLSRLDILREKQTGFSELPSIIDSAEEVIYKRLLEFATVAATFDEKEYFKFKKGELDLKDDELIQRKMSIYNGTLKEIDHITDENEELILRLDETIQALNHKSNDSDWNTETLLTMKKITDCVNKLSNAAELDKKSSLDAFDIYNQINNTNDDKVLKI